MALSCTRQDHIIIPLHALVQVGNRLEFVLTNGSGKFDSPNPYGEPGHPKNYVIEAPGVWELEGGKLRRLA